MLSHVISSELKTTFISVIQQINEVMAREAGKPAVRFNNSYLTYQELSQQSDKLCNHLISQGVGRGDAVTVCMEKSIYTVLSILAIWKIGAVYAPIDSQFPSQRIAHILTDTKANYMITTTAKASKMRNIVDGLDCINIDSPVWQNNDGLYTKANLASEHLAYILYTSGSTGKPKGVMVTHGNLISITNSWKQQYNLTSKDVHLQMANFTFDVFIGDVVRSLCVGSTLVLCPKNVLIEPKQLYELMYKESITIAEFVPTIVRGLVEYVTKNHKQLDFMRLMICGSDNWSMGEYRNFKKLLGAHTQLISSYGLTEATIDSTYYEENRRSDVVLTDEQAVPIGKPFSNTTVYILNKELQPVATGEMGEIYLAGSGISKGYLNLPKLTNQRFILHEIDHKELRLYKTGDLGRYLHDGNIEFLGRVDNQVKIHGVRIELSGIENMLNTHPSVRESMVIVHNFSEDNQRLIALVVTEKNIHIASDDLKNFMREKLPSYMIPSIFILQSKIPTTLSGKLDRKFLENIPAQSLHVAPRNHLEEELVKMWETVLCITHIGVLDSFDAIGGDSMLFTKLIHAVEIKYEIDFPAVALKHCVTIADIAEVISSFSNQ
tara:strand:+ start:33414 stop:35231 length:1818 start_codon:yes stop_codon:yes gene_type:complete